MTRASTAKGETTVTVLGCGLMGSAIARFLAENGHTVVVWNRTHARAAELERDSVRAIREAAEAVSTGELVLACMTTYDNVSASLDGIEDLSGKVLVNVTTGTPAQAAAMERWTRERGGRYLDGAIFCYPEEVGQPKAKFLFSGAPELWDQTRATLGILGGESRFVSTDIGAANAVLAGAAAFYIPALCSFLESVTYMTSRGLPADEVRSSTLHAIDNLRHVTDELHAALEAGQYEEDQATLDTYAEGLKTVLAALAEDAQAAPIADAAMGSLAAACRAGLGE